MQPIRVNYELKPQDADAFASYVVSKTGSMIDRIKPSGWVCVLSIFSLLAFFTSPEESRNTSLLINVLSVLLPIILVVSVWFVLTKAAEKRQASQMELDPLFSQTHSISICPDGVEQIDSSSRTFTKWSAIQNIVKDDAHIYLFISPKMAYIIPHRAFPDLSQFEEFYRSAYHYWQMDKS